MRPLSIFPLLPLLFASLLASSWGDEEEVKSATVNGRPVLIAQNHYLCIETITVTATLENARCSVPLPFTVELAPGATRELCSFGGVSNAPWHYHFHWNNQLGSAASSPDPNYLYALPYPKGRTYEVCQGFNGRFSHMAPHNCAIDWAMPIGSPVCAARDGLVVKIKSDSNQGGPTPDFLKMANVISVLHSDGTIGEYLHLQQNSPTVKVGQRIKTGDVIALSGNTGFSSTPHLHFHVTLPVDGDSFRTLPIQYQLGVGKTGVPEKGQRYTAQ